MNKVEILHYFEKEWASIKKAYQNTTIRNRLIAIPVFCFLFLGLIYNQYYIYKINNCDYQVVSCNVYEVVSVIKNPGFGISFRFNINGNEYDEYDTEPNIYKDNIKYYLVGRRIPLLVCKSDPKYFEILLAPEDFEERGLTYPDSMRVYLEFLK